MCNLKKFELASDLLHGNFLHVESRRILFHAAHGYAMFGGRKVPIEKPRVRSKKTGRDIELDSSHRRFQQDIRLEQAVMDQMALGLSTRNYELSIRAMCEGYGITKSSVSRRFITASRTPWRS